MKGIQIIQLIEEWLKKKGIEIEEIEETKDLIDLLEEDV